MAYQDELNQEVTELQDETEQNALNATDSTENAPEITDTQKILPDEETDAQAETQEATENAIPADCAPLDAEPDEEIEFEIEDDAPKAACIADKARQVRDEIQEKYAEARTACKGMMERISNDMEQTNYNPYIRSTTTYRYEILRKSGDTEPVDVFEFERSSGFSLRAMAITSALVAVADIALAKLLKKKLF